MKTMLRLRLKNKILGYVNKFKINSETNNTIIEELDLLTRAIEVVPYETKPSVTVEILENITPYKGRGNELNNALFTRGSIITFDVVSLKRKRILTLNGILLERSQKVSRNSLYLDRIKFLAV